MQRILGLDPGLRITGYGVIGCEGGPRPTLVEAGVFRIPTTATLEIRLRTLYQQVCELLEEYTPQAIAVEELFSHYERPRTAILMGHARGVLLLAAAEREIPVAGYLPTRVKKSMTGSGRADKSQMQLAVQHQFGLSAPLQPPDVADALAIALCHYCQTGFLRKSG